MTKEDRLFFIRSVEDSKLNLLGRLLLFVIPIVFCYYEVNWVLSFLDIPKEHLVEITLLTLLVFNPFVLLTSPALVIFPKTIKYILTGAFSFNLVNYFNCGTEEEPETYFIPYSVVCFIYHYIFGNWKKTYKSKKVELDESDPDIMIGKAEVEKLLKEV